MRLRFKPFWLAIGYAFVVFVLFLSLTPDRPDLKIQNAYKFGHVLAYAWLMFWFALIYRSTSTRMRIAFLCCAMGIGLEYLQGLTDYRSFAYTDMLLNAGGVSLGFLLSQTSLQNSLVFVESLLPMRILRKS